MTNEAMGVFPDDPAWQAYDEYRGGCDQYNAPGYLAASVLSNGGTLAQANWIHGHACAINRAEWCDSGGAIYDPVAQAIADRYSAVLWTRRCLEGPWGCVSS